MAEVRLPLLPAWLRWVGVAAVTSVIFLFSVVFALPEDAVTQPFSFIPLDKWRHFLAYAAFAVSLAYATTDWEWPTRRLAVLVLGATLAYGVGIEVWQAFVPARYFSLGDAYANTLGAVLASPWYLVRSRLSFVPLRAWAGALVN